MRLNELLIEDISAAEAIKNIIDILTTQLPALYQSLSRMSDNYYDNHGTIDSGFNFITGGPTSKWYNDVFFKHMKPSLYKLNASLPRQVKDELTQFLSDLVGEGKFSSIESRLIGILDNISKATRNKQLSQAVAAANHAISNYYSHLADLNSGENDGDVTMPNEPQEPNPVAQQNVTVADIINDTLSRIDRAQAGEIRNAIARQDNKLAALQQELNRRGIRLQESINKRIRMYHG